MNVFVEEDVKGACGALLSFCALPEYCEFYAVAVGYIKIFNIEEKMEAAVLLPKETSVGASAASLRRELPVLPGADTTSQCLDVKPGLKPQIWIYNSRISYDSAEVSML